jgi:hypothetical protein
MPHHYTEVVAFHALTTWSPVEKVCSIDYIGGWKLNSLWYRDSLVLVINFEKSVIMRINNVT